MTTTPTPPDTTPQAGPRTDRTDGNPDTAGGDIARLNAFDGLFLRAEHLTAMQDYARDLAHAVGAAGGPGVVDGYDVTATPEGLRVDAGFAVSAAGRPLRSRRVVVLPWSTFTRPTDGWFRIEVGPADWGFDEATVQALLCDAPCSGGSRATLHRAEGVRIHVETATATGFDARTDQRGWLASHLFAEEEKAAGAWPDTTTGLLDRTWRPPPSAARADRLPLAVVIPDDGDPELWTVDVWAVRRDRGAPPPDDHWRWRLAMRPWPAFVAQVLQFQDHYAAALRPAPGTAPLTRDTVRSDLTEILDLIRGGRTKDPAAKLEKVLAQIDPATVRAGAALFAALSPELPAAGIAELPPAGLLLVGPAVGVVASAAEFDAVVEKEVVRQFGGVADVRVSRREPDGIGLAIEQARHRRRFRIDDAEHRPPVDVLVPVEDGTWVGDWVAFVRRDGDAVDVPGPEPVGEVDTVEVFVVDDREQTVEAFTADVEVAQSGRVPDRADPPVVLRYPAHSWAQPQDDQRTLLARIQGVDGSLTAVAFVADETRFALALVRAGLLSTGYRTAGTVLPHVSSVVTGRDAIVILMGPLLGVID